jgi:pimeloyl-ACP methyl ester carboxylesterase
MTSALRSRRVLLAAVAAGAVAIAGIVSVSPAGADPSADIVAASRPVVPVLDWADCDDGFQCATAAVPLDYRTPRRATIDVSLIRRPAIDQANRIGSLFLAHPAGTVDTVRQAPPGIFALLSRFDVIGYDGRGSGPTAIDCDIDEALLDPFSSNATRPGAIDERAMVAAADEYGHRCLRAHGALLRHMSTATMARDLDLLRAAVGDDKLTFFGDSQGTDLGATYASMFPGRVRAMVFDAPVDAAGWRDRPFEIFREQDVSYEQELDRFFVACATNPDECGFGGDDPESAFDELLADLDAEPIDSSDPDHPGPVDGDDVRTAAAEMMLDPRLWAGLAEALNEAAGGDGALVQQIVDGAVDNETALDAFIANNAVSARYPRRLADYLADLSHRYGLHDHFWARGAFLGLVAQRWPAESRDSFRGDFDNPATAPTILVIGGTHDPATPYQWAERLTHDLGNARLLTYRSDGHGSLNDGDPCVLLPAAAYLVDPATLPPEGTVCDQTFEPFSS